MRKPLTKAYLVHLKQVIYQKEANAVTDRDADRTDIDTDVLQDLIVAAQKGLDGEELAKVGRTVVHLDNVGIITLDSDTRRELDLMLEPFQKAPVLKLVQEEPAPSL
jgi:hypothetical protein